MNKPKVGSVVTAYHHRAAANRADRVEWAVYRTAAYAERLGTFYAAPSAGLGSNLTECRDAFGEHVVILRQSDGMRLDWYA